MTERKYLVAMIINTVAGILLLSTLVYTIYSSNAVLFFGRLNELSGLVILSLLVLGVNVLLWFFRKYTPRLGVFVTILFVFLTLLTYDGFQDEMTHFTINRWENLESERGYMIDDFLTKVNLEGESRYTVVDYLGRPNDQNGNVYAYDISTTNGDYRLLKIEFNSKGKVTKVYKVK